MTDHAQYAEALALYVLGSLDDARELNELEEHLEDCVQCQEELAVLRGDAALLALSAVGPAPPQRSRQRLMEAIRKEPRFRRAPRQILGVLGTRRISLVPVAAAILLASFSLMLLLENSRLRRQRDASRVELQNAGDELQKVKAIADLLQDPAALHSTLVAMKTPPQPQVKTIYSPARQNLLLVASRMETLPADKIYELWLLPTDGSAPVPAGTFRPDAKGNAIMQHPIRGGMEAKAFAITIEPAGGSTTPTMPIMMVSAG